MTRLSSLLIFASLVAPCFSQSRCEPPPPLVIDVDHTIEGMVPQDRQPVWHEDEGISAKEAKPVWSGADVFLYSRGRLVRAVTSDGQGRFTLDRLPLGVYKLSIQGAGTFDVKVVPANAFRQQRYYGFGLWHGCRTWGFSTN